VVGIPRVMMMNQKAIACYGICIGMRGFGEIDTQKTGSSCPQGEMVLMGR